MRNEESLLFVRRASRTQVAISLGVSALLLAAFVATVPFTKVELRRYDSFLPSIDTALMMADLVTASILFSQAFVLRSRPLVVLAAGYMFSGFIIVAHALSFPGAFTPEGLIGGGTSTSGWLYFFWHCGLPIAAIVYAVQRQRPGGEQLTAPAMRRIVGCGIAASFAAACLLTLLSTMGHDLLPMAMPNTIQMSNTVFLMAVFLVLLLTIALAILASGPKSLIDIWLMVALWTWLLEMLLLMTLPPRFTVGWYSGRFAGLFSSLFVLFALVIESTRLYMQQSLSAASEQQQREGRLMSLDVAASAIAHEVKQPITAMVTNASAALIRAQKRDPDLAKVREALKLIVADGHRAGDIVGTIRALFGQHETGETLVDLNELIIETLDLRSMEIASRAITATLDLEDDLPKLRLQRLQMRQVMINLLNNAVEAFSERTAKHERNIIIRSNTTDEGGVMIDVVDTGRGIAAEHADRIFDAFYTTKPNGTGIGLPLCRSIVEAHMGNLSVTSVAGRGSTFSVALPGPEA